jgi:hypothetical protein
VESADSHTPGADREPCKLSSGAPADLEFQAAGSLVKSSDTRFGAIDPTDTYVRHWIFPPY